MRVFITGATGFVGSAVVRELLGAGHRVVGLARSEKAAASLISDGAEACRGDLGDAESLQRGAAISDAVIHTAFDHDFSKFAESSQDDKRAIEALGKTLEGSDRPLIVTSGLPLVPGRLATEDDAPQSDGGTPRVSEQTADALAARGVHASVVRMAQVHDRDRQGFATYLIALAREKGVSAYVGEGRNRWPAVHRLDAASLFRLALEEGSAGSKYHAVGEEGISVREIAEAIGRRLGMPVVSLSIADASGHFGVLAMAANMEAPASSTLTQQRLGWQAKQKSGFLDDLQHSSAFSA